MENISLNSLKALTIFKTLYENSSATKTAAVLGITQSGVSRSLGQLEENLGIQLFIREKNRLIATPEAQELYSNVLALMINLDELKHNVAALREFGASRVRIASIPGLAFGYLPKVIARLQQEVPKLNIYFDIMASSDVVRSVESGIFDLGVITLPTTSQQLIVEELIKTEAVCLLPKSHPLANKKEIHLEDFRHQHLVIPNQPNVAADQLLRLIRDNRIQIAGKTESNIASICALVEQGVGISVINSITANDLAPKNVLLKPFAPTIHYAFGLVYQKHWSDNKLTQMIRDHLTP
ncbi:LysR family transcriptional regulator [Pseudomaricurvus alkylphenolicus]|uniref:LysR family transcriptional regulator n=1 Tax=Pseudomaricurvus alkylphenolicus TaxID=1306991 RepID=UPI0014205F4B|nr:LysR family transcriptional regulator [Pseudomaricurvus alkylphenolicus]NIB38575.1 LysR family transcriptional regulator [Pseudomaricurvus alkylphenolicus]